MSLRRRRKNGTDKNLTTLPGKLEKPSSPDKYRERYMTTVKNKTSLSSSCPNFESVTVTLQKFDDPIASTLSRGYGSVPDSTRSVGNKAVKLLSVKL